MKPLEAIILQSRAVRNEGHKMKDFVPEFEVLNRFSSWKKRKKKRGELHSLFCTEAKIFGTNIIFASLASGATTPGIFSAEL